MIISKRYGRDRTEQAGFSQYIAFDWVDAAASLAFNGETKPAAQASLNDLLKDRVSVGTQAVRSTRDKIITILVNVWVAPPEELRPFRDEGLALWHAGSRDERVALHWGMSMAVYPFFASVAESVGRLIKLQGTFNIAQTLRRVHESFGERETVTRAAQRIIQSITNWGVLQRLDKRGNYAPVPTRSVCGAPALWLAEAYLRTLSNRSGLLRSVINTPSLFPFALTLPDNGLRSKQVRLEFMRQGLDEDIISLVRSPQPIKESL